ncbi:STAS domain-containing protein [Pseudomonas sp. 6D_7.1_Bac1]|nr:STAS domain-containing protein [Pseudomonas sp. 6D_7.1_Bac1]MCU1752516.1 STAS domain-containing protein [Pseudomonas sp. 6D_7.1_Bac1]
MGVEAVISPDGKKLTISIKGRFDLGSYQEFRGSYEHLVFNRDDKHWHLAEHDQERPHNKSPEPSSVVVDLKETTYLDSSALGMLLLLRDHAGGDRADISVVNSNSDVRKILAISNFNKLFDIS